MLMTTWQSKYDKMDMDMCNITSLGCIYMASYMAKWIAQADTAKWICVNIPSGPSENECFVLTPRCLFRALTARLVTPLELKPSRLAAGLFLVLSSSSKEHQTCGAAG